jgi:polyphosphate glucokinase
MQILGIDIGGSGIKGAPVDITTGQILAPRYRLPTPQPATPKAVLAEIEQIIKYFNWQGDVGCGYPGVVKHGITHSAANLDEAWLGFNLKAGIEAISRHTARVINDADAAGIAEMVFGAGRGHLGMVVMVTLGTGIGVSAFIDGKLIPNLELGHIEIKGEDAEYRAAEAARERDGLTWKQWAKRVDRYLHRLERLISPDLYIIGGGVSKKWDKFFPYLEKTQTELVPAQLQNEAGIIGAAMAEVYDHDSDSPTTQP